MPGEVTEDHSSQAEGGVRSRYCAKTLKAQRGYRYEGTYDSATCKR